MLLNCSLVKGRHVLSAAASYLPQLVPTHNVPTRTSCMQTALPRDCELKRVRLAGIRRRLGLETGGAKALGVLAMLSGSGGQPAPTTRFGGRAGAAVCALWLAPSEGGSVGGPPRTYLLNLHLPPSSPVLPLPPTLGGTSRVRPGWHFWMIKPLTLTLKILPHPPKNPK